MAGIDTSIRGRAVGWIREIGSTVNAVRLEWKRDNASLLAAAVAFYATFSLAPLLVLILSAAAAVLGAEAARHEVVDVIARFVNPRTAEAANRLLAPNTGEDGITITVVSVLLLIVGASGVFRHLRSALDLVLDVPPAGEAGWKAVVRARLVSVFMVVVALVLLLSSVALTTVLATIRKIVPTIPAADIAVWRGVEIVVTTVVVAAVFAAILKFVPDARLEWRNVGIAAIPAAILFGGGRYLLGTYMSRTNVTTMYGAAASLFVLLVATYFAVVVLFLAAELTEVLARRDHRFTEDRAKRQAAQGHQKRKPDEDGSADEDAAASAAGPSGNG